jgi:type II secretory pathway pseudopilin PulG
LIEVIVALAILGMLAATVYMSLDGALRGIERVRSVQEPYQRGRVARSFLESALRSTALFSGLAQDGFVAVDSSRAGISRDELTFVALAPPGAETVRMQLHLYVADSSGSSLLKLDVRPLSVGDSLAMYKSYTLTDGVAGLDIIYLAAPADERSTWVERWDSRIRSPHAVRITFLPSTRPDPLYQTPIVIQLPVGRIL